MRRGDLVSVAMTGDFGKPGPALVIQSDLFTDTGTVTVRKPSQIMVEKAMTVKRDKIGETIGRLDNETMISVNRSPALFLGFG